MKEPIDWTDKLAEKRDSLIHRRVDVQYNGASVDYFFIFALSFSLLVLATEPLFIFFWE
jgi:hypothetical protein